MKSETRSMLKEFFPLLIAIALQQVLALTVNLVDNFMLGAYSETAMSGASLVNQIQYILQQLITGIAVGVSVLGAQYWGKQDIDPIRRIIAIGLRFGFIAGALFCAFTFLFPHQILSLLANDADVIATGAQYLQLMCWTYVIYSVSAILMYSMRSVQTAFIGTVMSGCTIFINMFLNYVFIYGNFGAPELGIRGAAIATLVSRTVELILIVVYILFIDKKLRIKPQDLLRFDASYLRDYIHVAIPAMVTGSMWGVSQAAQTAILGHISAETIAANSIASVIFQVFSAFGFSSANAASVIIGKTIGNKRFHLIRPYTQTLQVLFLCIGLIDGSLLFLCKDFIVGLYVLTPETTRLAIKFLNILSFTLIFSCFEYPIEGGIIAGGGDTKYSAIVDNCFMWLYTIPLSYLSAFVFHWPPAITFFCLKSDQILKCIPNFICCNRYKWIRNLTR